MKRVIATRKGNTALVELKTITGECDKFMLNPMISNEKKIYSVYECIYCKCDKYIAFSFC